MQRILLAAKDRSIKKLITRLLCGVPVHDADQGTLVRAAGQTTKAHDVDVGEQFAVGVRSWALSPAHIVDRPLIEAERRYCDVVRRVLGPSQVRRRSSDDDPRSRAQRIRERKRIGYFFGGDT